MRYLRHISFRSTIEILHFPLAYGQIAMTQAGQQGSRTGAERSLLLKTIIAQVIFNFYHVLCRPHLLPSNSSFVSQTSAYSATPSIRMQSSKLQAKGTPPSGSHLFNQWITPVLHQKGNITALWGFGCEAGQVRTT